MRLEYVIKIITSLEEQRDEIRTNNRNIEEINKNIVEINATITDTLLRIGKLNIDNTSNLEVISIIDEGNIITEERLVTKIDIVLFKNPVITTILKDISNDQKNIIDSQKNVIESSHGAMEVAKEQLSGVEKVIQEIVLEQYDFFNKVVKFSKPEISKELVKNKDIKKLEFIDSIVPIKEAYTTFVKRGFGYTKEFLNGIFLNFKFTSAEVDKDFRKLVSIDKKLRVLKDFEYQKLLDNEEYKALGTSQEVQSEGILHNISEIQYHGIDDSISISGQIQESIDLMV